MRRGNNRAQGLNLDPVFQKNHLNFQQKSLPHGHDCSDEHLQKDNLQIGI